MGRDDPITARRNGVRFCGVSNPEGKFDLNEQIVPGPHRAGWANAIQALAPLHNSSGVFVDGFLECLFAWDVIVASRRGEIPFRIPWVGFLHNPPGMPRFLDYRSSPQMIFDSWHMRESLPYCQGIFVLSEYLADWLSERIDVPVNALTHPTELSVPQFSLEQFLQIEAPKIVQVGNWLRRINSIKLLPTVQYEKQWIVQHEIARKHAETQIRNSDTFSVSGLSEVGQYSEVEWLPNSDYDELLTECVVFVDLYDSSANNTIIECIARSTPVLVNPLPAVREYLGNDYPLYFESLEDAAFKADNKSFIEDAHNYLKSMDKSRFSYERFLSDVQNSEIYQNLPAPSARYEKPSR